MEERKEIEFEYKLKDLAEDNLKLEDLVAKTCQQVMELGKKIDANTLEMKEFTAELKEERLKREHETSLQSVKNNQLDGRIDTVEHKIESLETQIKTLDESQKFNIMDWLKNNFVAIALVLVYIANEIKDTISLSIK